jgi:hypothetical protein
MVSVHNEAFTKTEVLGKPLMQAHYGPIRRPRLWREMAGLVRDEPDKFNGKKRQDSEYFAELFEKPAGF